MKCNGLIAEYFMFCNSNFFFYWSFTPFSTLIQLYQGNSSLIYDPWQTSPNLGNVHCPRALHHVHCNTDEDQTRGTVSKIPP